MFDGLAYHAARNERAAGAYEDAVCRLRETHASAGDVPGPWSDWLGRVSGFLVTLVDLEERPASDRGGSTLEFLAAENEAIYRDLLPANYAGSFADPAHAAAVLGAEAGPIASLVDARCRELVSSAFTHERFALAHQVRRFLDVADLVRGGGTGADELRALLTRIDREDRTEEFVLACHGRFDPAFRFARDIAESAEPGDESALYRYGRRVTESDLRTARFLAGWSQEKVDRLADTIMTAFRRGFEIEGKDIAAKSSVLVAGPIGYERLFARLFPALDDAGIAPVFIPRPSAALNRQFEYDHRFDYALTLDQQMVEARVAAFEDAVGTCADMARASAGVIVVETFGESPFSPELKPACLTADAETAALHQQMKGRIAQATNAAAPREESSFSIIAFPSPEIRGDFEAIFADTLEINTLPNDRYERIQHEIIAALDRAEHVRVRGRAGNRTDLRVMMPPIPDPATQTNFLNCVADLNIPVGEVFTSPRLTGTNGILHVEEAFLGGLRFVDLEFRFEDGCIADYGCANFDDESENRKYVHENIIYPHDSLPIGEFAIGTNTLAYAVAKKHGIMDLLPVLIIEKMGPHLAVGDTCFSWQEDHVVRNPLDGKEVVARENERSRRRTEDVSAAYTNKHTDITLPYSSLDSIAAVLPGGEEIALIRDGRFVLPGTEELNAAIDSVDA